MKIVILGVIALLSFVGSSFTSRESKHRRVRNAWLMCFVIALVLQVLALREGFIARPNTLTIGHMKAWQNMELTTKEFTGSYSASAFLEESNPGKPLGRVTITAKSDRACGLSLHCNGNNIIFDKAVAGLTSRTISFEIGKPPLELHIRADSPAVITISGSHNIGEYTIEFSNSLPSQLTPKEL